MATEMWVSRGELRNYVSVTDRFFPSTDRQLTRRKVGRGYEILINEVLGRKILANISTISNGNLLYFPPYKKILSHNPDIQPDKALLLISLLYGISSNLSKAKLASYVESVPYAQVERYPDLHRSLLSDSQHHITQEMIMTPPGNQDIPRSNTLFAPLTRNNKYELIGFEVNTETFDTILQPVLKAIRIAKYQILLNNAIVWHGNWVVFDEWGEFEVYTYDEFSKRFSRS